MTDKKQGIFKKFGRLLDDALLGGAEAEKYRKDVHEIYLAGGSINAFEKALLKNQHLSERLEYLTAKHDVLMTSIPVNLRPRVMEALKARCNSSRELVILEKEKIQLKRLQKEIKKATKLCKEYERHIINHPNEVARVVAKRNINLKPGDTPFNASNVKLRIASQSTLEAVQNKLKGLLQEQAAILNGSSYQGVDAGITAKIGEVRVVKGKEVEVFNKTETTLRSELVRNSKELSEYDKGLTALKERNKNKEYSIEYRKPSVFVGKVLRVRDRVVFKNPSDSADKGVEYKVKKNIGKGKNKGSDAYVLISIKKPKHQQVFRNNVKQYQDKEGKPVPRKYYYIDKEGKYYYQDNKGEYYSKDGEGRYSVKIDENKITDITRHESIIVPVKSSTENQFNAIENARNSKSSGGTEPIKKTISLPDLNYGNKMADAVLVTNHTAISLAKCQLRLGKEVTKQNKRLQKKGGKDLNNAEKKLNEIRKEINEKNSKKTTRFQRFVERVSHKINRTTGKQILETDLINKLKLTQDQIRKNQDQTSKNVEKAQKSLLAIATNLGVEVTDKDLQQILVECQTALDAKQKEGVEKYQKDHSYRTAFNKAAQILILAGVAVGATVTGGTGAAIAVPFAATGIASGMFTGPRKTYLIEKTWKDAKGLGKQFIGVVAGTVSVGYTLGKKTVNDIHKKLTGSKLFDDLGDSWRNTAKKAWQGKDDSPNLAHRMRHPQRTKTDKTKSRLKELVDASQSTTTEIPVPKNNQDSGVVTKESTVLYSTGETVIKAREVEIQESRNPIKRLQKFMRERNENRRAKLEAGIQGLSEKLKGTKIISTKKESTSSTKPPPTPSVPPTSTYTPHF